MLQMFQPLLDHFQRFAIECGTPSFFGLPTWYQYVCGRDFVFPNDIPLVLLGVVSIMLRLAGIVAIAYVVFGGIKYVVSQGEPDKVSEAKGTIINALIGLVIASVAVAIVSFVGNKLG